jgi:NADH:ubiquinone oxidoreductase subunit E
MYMYLFSINRIDFITYPEDNQVVSRIMEVKMPSQSLNQILEGRHSQPGQLIEVLQDVQKNYGYIPEEAMRAAAEGLGVPLMEVYRVASFYKAFKLKPCGRNHFIVCMGTACHVRGARLLLEQAVGQLGIDPGEVTPDGLFSVEHVNCLGACALGPIVRERESWHNHMTPGKLRKLIKSLRRQGTEETQHAQA